MDEGFDSEFYRSPWQHVLPLGPHGIQPYVQTSRGAGGLSAGLHGLITLLSALARELGTFGRSAASGLAPRPMASMTAPRVQG
jgi:hypothetical protein